jgi:uncharacterized 2Fe-2S/4Fe-4S cluster protein (DUF4445 family)
MLCARAETSESDLASVSIAGSFGYHVRKSSLRALGLCARVPPTRLVVVGNAAGVGARLALLDTRVRTRASVFASRATVVDLAGRRDYAEAFTRLLRFPEPVSLSRVGHL